MSIASHKMPRAYLAGFASPGNRAKLWVYERGKPPRIGTPKNESREKGFFSATQPDGSADDAPAESWAETIESRAVDVLRNVASPVFVWTYANRKSTAEYWALQFLRASAFFDYHRESWEKLVLRSSERVISDLEYRQNLARRYSFIAGRQITEEEVLKVAGGLLPKLSKETEMRDHYVQNLQRRVELFSEVISAKRWVIWTAPEGAEFVTSDSPVVTMKLDNWGRYSVGYGLGREDVLVLLPVSAAACLVAGQAGHRARTATASDIYEINKTVTSSSKRFTYARSHSDAINQVVQTFAGTTRYGVNAFRSDEPEGSFDLFG